MLVWPRLSSISFTIFLIYVYIYIYFYLYLFNLRFSRDWPFACMTFIEYKFILLSMRLYFSEFFVVVEKEVTIFWGL